MGWSRALRGRVQRNASAVLRFDIALPRSRAAVRVMGQRWLRSRASVAGRAQEASRARSDSEFPFDFDGLLPEAEEPPHRLKVPQETCGIQGTERAGLQRTSGERIAVIATGGSTLRNPRCKAGSPNLEIEAAFRDSGVSAFLRFIRTRPRARPRWGGRVRSDSPDRASRRAACRPKHPVG